MWEHVWWFVGGMIVGAIATVVGSLFIGAEQLGEEVDGRD